MNIKFIILAIACLISFDSLYCQNKELNKRQLDALNPTKQAFYLRMTFLLDKEPSSYDSSFVKFVQADSLVSSLRNDNAEKIDQEFYETISNSTHKELGTTKEDITKLSEGAKSETKIGEKSYQLTDGERTYYTFLFLVLIKIDHKLKDLTTGQ